MLAPGLDLVTVTGDRLRSLANARLGADKVKRDLLRALAAFDIRGVLVFMDARYNTRTL
jgi:hypothetical protein